VVATPPPSHEFSSVAAAYQRTLAPALRPIAERVVARAALQPNERILDIGTGTGTAAGIAAGEGRHVVGLDLAPGMLAIARELHPAIEFVEADYGAIPADDASFDVVLAVHALHFAADRVAALREWRRVTRPGGRLAVSVPGPASVTWAPVILPTYEAHGIGAAVTRFPDADELASWGRDAGWTEIETVAEPGHVMVLADDDRFRDWMSIGARGGATSGWTPGQRSAFERELIHALPADGSGGYRLPFGALFLMARRGGA
jgi:SAM-dependent methyltransferase